MRRTTQIKKYILIHYGDRKRSPLHDQTTGSADTFGARGGPVEVRISETAFTLRSSGDVLGLSFPDRRWSAASPFRRMTRYLDSVGMLLRCGCSRQWPEKKDKSMSAPLTKFRTQAFDPHQMPSYSLIYSINGVIY